MMMMMSMMMIVSPRSRVVDNDEDDGDEDVDVNNRLIIGKGLYISRNRRGSLMYTNGLSFLQGIYISITV